VFDSRVRRAYEGLRAAAPQVRRVLFQAPGYELDLEVTRTPEQQTVRVAGQLLAIGGDLDDAFVCLASDTKRYAALERNGYFEAEGVPPGVYRIEMRCGDALVEVRRLLL
jgi:hypothetical protein